MHQLRNNASGVSKTKFSRILFPLKTMVVGGLPSLDFFEMVFDVIGIERW